MDASGFQEESGGAEPPEVGEDGRFGDEEAVGGVYPKELHTRGQSRCWWSWRTGVQFGKHGVSHVKGSPEAGKCTGGRACLGPERNTCFEGQHRRQELESRALISCLGTEYEVETKKRVQSEPRGTSPLKGQSPRDE